MTADELLARIAAIGGSLATLDARSKLEYEKRLALFKKGRAMGVSNEAMAAAAGVTEAAVIMAMRKDVQLTLAAEHAKGEHKRKHQSCPGCYPPRARR